MAESTTTVEARISLSVGGSEPVEVSTIDIPVNWTIEKSAFGWSTKVDTAGLDSIVETLSGAIEQALDPTSEAQPEVTEGGEA